MKTQMITFKKSISLFFVLFILLGNLNSQRDSIFKKHIELTIYQNNLEPACVDGSEVYDLILRLVDGAQVVSPHPNDPNPTISIVLEADGKFVNIGSKPMEDFNNDGRWEIKNGDWFSCDDDQDHIVVSVSLSVGKVKTSLSEINEEVGSINAPWGIGSVDQHEEIESFRICCTDKLRQDESKSVSKRELVQEEKFFLLDSMGKLVYEGDKLFELNNLSIIPGIYYLVKKKDGGVEIMNKMIKH